MDEAVPNYLHTAIILVLLASILAYAVHAFNSYKALMRTSVEDMSNARMDFNAEE